MQNEKLTGNIRYRVTHTLVRPSKVLLQVEIVWDDGPDDWHGMPTYLKGKGWRDAKPEDLQYLNVNKC